MGFPPTPQPYQGPNYQGFVFNLVSSNGKPSHLLTISTQIGETVAHVAYLTGTWQGEKASSPMNNPKAVTGLITDNGIGIQCSWTTPNGSNTLVGSLTYTPGHFVETQEENLHVRGFIPPEASLDGTVTAYDMDGNVLPNTGPGNVAGLGKGW